MESRKNTLIQTLNELVLVLAEVELILSTEK